MTLNNEINYCLLYSLISIVIIEYHGVTDKHNISPTYRKKDSVIFTTTRNVFLCAQSLPGNQRKVVEIDQRLINRTIQ